MTDLYFTPYNSLIMIKGGYSNSISEPLDRRVNFNLLYDFYSPLLTEKQRKVYELVCFSDMSLSEAADNLNVSRQAVHIARQKVEHRLLSLEKKLAFAKITRNLEDKIFALEQKIKCLNEV